MRSYLELEKNNCHFLTLFSKLNSAFNYDWTDYTTIHQDQTFLSEIEIEIERVTLSINNLSLPAKKELGQLIYKVGTFHLYVNFNPSLALQKFEQAKMLLDKLEHAWVLNQIALCHSYLGNVEMSRRYVKPIMQSYFESDLDEHEGLTLIAIAAWINALNDYQQRQVQSATNNANFAIEMLEKMQINNDLYGIIKLTLARARAENLQEFAAKIEFTALEDYWMEREKNKPIAKKFIHNPYLGEFYSIYAAFLEKSFPEKIELILNKYTLALHALNQKSHDESRLSMIQAKVAEYKNKLNYSMPSLAFFSTHLNHTSVNLISPSQDKTKDETSGLTL